MKKSIIILCIPLMLSFTQPFATDGSVSNDSAIMQERVEKAHQNRVDQKEALELIGNQKQEQQEEFERNDKEDEKEKLNEAEKLIR